MEAVGFGLRHFVIEFNMNSRILLSVGSSLKA